MDYWRLIRPRIVLLVLFAMAVAAWTSGEQRPAWTDLAHALVGTALVIAGAMALNQRWEVRGDARMPRTSGRPLPTGRLTARQVTGFGLLVSAAGLGYLLVASQPGVVVLALASWVVYVLLYTPLKSRTIWQTPVGAAAGAMPVLIGAAVARTPMSPMALSLFGIVCLWQFPHAMAIAWLYRQEFASAEVRVATVVDPSGRAAGVLAVLGAAALVAVSMIPPALALVGWTYAGVAMLLGAGYLACAVRFLGRRDDASARWLLRASLVYLPAVFAALLL
ncbi:MAG TPA: heme o synthase [Thermoguttaceae bacterium]|nr:heme o synthase [Thermoguttaceae bacterium]HUU84991.1 heme o synthase [Phycisphaerae bacterium]